MSPLTSDACPSCGERMLPVLDTPTSRGPVPGPLLADPPVGLRCPECPAAEAPSLLR